MFKYRPLLSRVTVQYITLDCKNCMVYHYLYKHNIMLQSFSGILLYLVHTWGAVLPLKHNNIIAAYIQLTQFIVPTTTDVVLITGLVEESCSYSTFHWPVHCVIRFI